MLKVFVTFIFLPLITNVWAGVSGSIGLEGSNSFEDHEKNEAQLPIINYSSFLGVRATTEWGWKFLSINLFASYLYANTEAQYEFQETRIRNLSGHATIFKLGAGPRISLLKSPSLRFFIGAGYNYGAMTLTYDKKEFIDRLGNTLGLKETESQRIDGHYLEFGINLNLNQIFALQFLVQNTTLKSQSYKTLGEHKALIRSNFYSLNFIKNFGK